MLNVLVSGGSRCGEACVPDKRHMGGEAPPVRLQKHFFQVLLSHFKLQ